jgi:hypothetical protein
MKVDARDPEPPGPWVLTWMNGVVDVGSARFCFVPVTDGGEAPTDDAPFPAAGLSFGAHFVVTSIGTADLRTTDLHPYLVVGADGTGSMSCKQIVRGAAPDAASDGGPAGADAGSSSPVAVSLPLISAGTLAESRSYLAVANGCALPAAARSTTDAGGAVDASDAGDAAETGDDGTAARLALCGSAFGPTSLGLSLVRLSRRTDFSKVGFQVVNGSNATAPASFIIENSFTNVTLFFGDSLALGQIAPHAQPGYVDQDDFPALKGALDLMVEPPAGTAYFPAFQTTLGNVLTSSHLDASDLVAGSLFTFVLLGARSGQDAGSTGHPFGIELVSSTPTTSDD